jgi:hypothetical protein
MSEKPHNSNQDPAGVDNRTAFPTNAVVGIVGEPTQLPAIMRELRSDGHAPEVLCGSRGVERIEEAGGMTKEEVKTIRSVQQLFGFEADHAERHQAALEAGDFLVVVAADNDVAADQVGQVLASHGGRFVNHYTRWTGRTLSP